jgi:hypothetical protein
MMLFSLLDEGVRHGVAEGSSESESISLDDNEVYTKDVSH